MKKLYYLFGISLIVLVAYFAYFDDVIYRYRLPELNRQHQLYVQAFNYAMTEAVNLDGTQYIGNFVFDSKKGVEYTFIYNGTEEELVKQNIIIYYECSVKPLGCKNQTFSGTIDELRQTIAQLAAYAKGRHDIPIQTKGSSIAIILPFKEGRDELIRYYTNFSKVS